MGSTPEWKKYQQQVADALASVGFQTETDETVSGARGSHDIDVTARMEIAGVGQLWVVECKKWSRAIPKERVLTFLSLTADVGADRGLMFSEKGFQAGAIRAASHTNVTLTSLEDFLENNREEILGIRLNKLDDRARLLSHRLLDLYDMGEAVQIEALSRYVGPPNILGRRNEPSGLLARLSQLREALEAGRRGRWPVAIYPLDHDDRGLITVSAMDGLEFFASHTLDAAESVYSQMIDEGAALRTLQELQSRELLDLLSAVRASAPPRRQ